MTAISSDPIRDYTNIKRFDFAQKLENVKKDGKDNVVSVSKETGDVTILTYPDKIPDNFSEQIPTAAKVKFFEDKGEDDTAVTQIDVNKFVMDVRAAGTPYDPASHISMLKDKVNKVKMEANERIGDRNLYYHIENSLNKLTESLDRKELDKTENYSKIINNVASSLYLGRPVYLPDFGWHNINRREPEIAGKLSEVSHIANFVKKHIEEH